MAVARAIRSATLEVVFRLTVLSPRADRQYKVTFSLGSGTFSVVPPMDTGTSVLASVRGGSASAVVSGGTSLLTVSSLSGLIYKAPVGIDSVRPIRRCGAYPPA